MLRLGRTVAALVLLLGLVAVSVSSATSNRTSSPSKVGPRATTAWTDSCTSRKAQRRVFVAASAPLARIVRARPAGTTFCLRRGIHRLNVGVVPKSGQSFVGEPGAVVSGAKDITSLFVKSDRYWVASGQTQHNPHLVGECRDSGTACTYPNDVFFDGRPLERVLALSELGSGRFFFDHEAGMVWIARDPGGHRVHAAVATRAFEGWGTGVVNVTIKGLVIEQFANASQSGAVRAGHGWSIDGNEIRLNHGVGLQGGDIVRRNFIHHNGQLGFSVHGSTGTLFANNVVAYNNYANYDWFWEAGGAKFMVTKRLIVRGNHVHHNRGTGLATDWDNVDTTYEGNTVEDNQGAGIFHEASYDAVIRQNVVLRNGAANPRLFDGAGIGVSTSQNVEIVGNTVVDNRQGVGIVDSDRDDGRYGAHATKNILVRNNTISFSGTIGTSGLASDDPADYATHQNRFQGNRYTYCQPMAFAWRKPSGPGYGLLTTDEWMAAGNDTTRSFRVQTGC